MSFRICFQALSLHGSAFALWLLLKPLFVEFRNESPFWQSAWISHSSAGKQTGLALADKRWRSPSLGSSLVDWLHLLQQEALLLLTKAVPHFPASGQACQPGKLNHFLYNISILPNSCIFKIPLFSSSLKGDPASLEW